ncbi:DUF5011 domain-containing protein [Clostridium sp. AL.422]|uniref:immunoglobulin-like domain-containing protein n=1 Tax=Clostridium TaxID=1485 RepID=UPI00293DD46E|nr:MULTISPECIES: immunoglobulin-like domain-containing protein [unclassified Clostridium]MDV4149266.1 DUF5011 domain-containing protein [Clostridium sp. AL.422]
MHNRIKALIVAAMVATNSVSPTLEVLANELERERVSEEIATILTTEEKTENNITLDINESEKVDKEESVDEKTEDSITLDIDESKSEEKEKIADKQEIVNKEENLIQNQTNILEENTNVTTKGINKLEIKPNQGAYDWGYGATNEIAILVDFDNITNKKVLEIELAEGMAFDRYPVKGSPSNKIEYEGTNEDKAVIANVLERPVKDLITNQYSGKLSYEINSSTRTANIVIKVSVDRYKYYGPKEIQNAIKVTVKESDKVQKSETINVQAVNNTLGEKNNSLNISATGRTMQAQRGDEATTYSYFRNTTSKVQTDNNGIMSFTYIKSAILTMYYPKHTTFVDVNNLPDGATVENKPADNKVIITMPNQTIENSNVSLTYKVDSDAPYGIIESKNNNTMEVEYYDGTKQTLIADKLDSVQVVDPNTLGSIIEMSVLDGYYHDYNGNSLSMGGYIYLDKATLIEYTDQVFEYSFSNWKTRKVLLPYGINDVVDIKYTLIGDTTEYSMTIDQLSDFGGENRLIDADKLNIGDDKYFEKVVFEVKSIQKDLNHIDKGRHNKYTISFGELEGGFDKGSTTVKIYSKANPNVKREISREITRVSKPEKIAISSGGASVTETADKSYKAKTIFEANKGFTREKEFSHYLENPEIIIRMPQGFNLSKSSIKLTQDKLPINFNITEHISKVDGAVIYTLETTDVKIGGFDPITLAVNPTLNIEFDFTVDANVGGLFNINQMIFIGKKGANIDKYYGNADIVVSTDDFGLLPTGENRSLGRSESKEFDIIKTSELIVTTHVRDSGSHIDKKPYDKADEENTAIKITKDSLIDFIVRIENNTLNATKEVEVYVPIPKKGLNMGIDVQEEEFTWDMELVKDQNGNVVNASDIFEISYGITESGKTKYSSDYSPNADVVKIVAKKDIEASKIEEIKFTFKAVDDIPEEQVGSLNVFNAIYTKKYDSGSKVILKGNSVGFKLATGNIKGIAFLDNDRDGLYIGKDNNGVDILLADIEVELFDKSGTLIAKSKTNSNGEYSFEGLSDGEYEVKVINKEGALDPNTAGAKRFTKTTTISGDSYKNDSDLVSTDNETASLSISMPTKSNINDYINDYINVGFVEPINISIITDGNGTVSGTNSGNYRIWQFDEIESPETVTPNIGYNFVNYTNADTGAVFTFPSEVSSDTTIKANFEKIRYQVSLHANEGTNGSKTAIEVAFDESIKDGLDSLTPDELPTRKGYKLVGWARKEDGTGIIGKDDKMEDSSITLYAVWEKVVYTVDLNANNGVAGSKPQLELTFEDNIKDSLDSLTPDELPTRKGYKLVGWSRKEDGTGLIGKDDKMEDSSITLYAVWEKVVYTVDLNANDGVAGSKPQLGLTFEDNIKDSLDSLTPDELPIRKGYKLVGWARNEDGTGLIGKDDKMEDSSITLYAVWDKASVIKGATDITIKVGSSLDLMDGIDAEDTEDGNLKGSIVVSGDKLDTNVPGRYEVIYTVTDSAGNITTVTRVVTVDGAPVITGVIDTTIKVGSSFDLMDGVDAADTEDGNLKGSIVVSGDKLDTNVPGRYEVIYTVKDSAGNETTITRVVTVDGAPVITGVTDTTIKVGSSLDLMNGIDAIDAEDGNLKGSIVVTGDKLDTNVPGRYEIIYTVTDSAGNETTVKRIVTVYGAPVIIGTEDTTLKVGSEFDPLAGVTAKDTEGKELNISISGDIVDVNKPGKYTVTYTVIDDIGNTTTVKRIVTVYGNPAIIGTDDITLKVGSEFDPLAGVTAKDTEGKELNISISGDTVDINKPGKYTVTYTATDDLGNVTTVNRIVIIEEINNSLEPDDSVDKEETEEEAPEDSVDKEETEEEAPEDSVDKEETEEEAPEDSVDKEETEEEAPEDSVDKEETEEEAPEDSVDKEETEEEAPEDSVDKEETEEETPEDSVDKEETDEEEKTEGNESINSNIPNTGDKGMFSYLLLAMSSMIGLVKSTKRKKE